MQTLNLALTIGLFLFLGIVVVAGWLQLRQIHAAVNSNMTTALNKIEDLHGRVAALVKEARHAERAKRAATKRRPTKGGKR